MELFVIFAVVFVISAAWAAWSLRDLKTPLHLYPKISRQVKKTLFGVIHLGHTSSRSTSSSK